MRTILSIIPYRLSQQDFFELREPIKEYPLHHFYNSLPEWCIREDSGHIDYTENYHQFTGHFKSNDPKKYVLFDINPVDLILQEEISNASVAGLFEGYDWRPLFEEIPFNFSPIKTIQIPFSVHIIVDLEYHDAGDNDYDLIVEVLGYLDGKMELFRI